MDYTRKRLVKVPEERNSLRTVDSRQEYCTVINHIDDEKLVFLGETGLNLHHSRNYSYSPKNSKAIKVVNANRGQNVSSLVAIKKSGIIAFEIKDGAFNGDAFIVFIREKLVPHFNNNTSYILIMNNCSFHHRRDVIKQFWGLV